MGWKDEEGNAIANTTEGGTSEVEEGEGDITRELMVATLTLHKGVAMGDEGATIEPT